jgi:hypothetical protein
MSNKHSHSDLLAKAIARVRAKHNLPNASEEVDLRCPRCGFTASEDQFDEVDEPDTDEESDSEGGDEREDDSTEDSYRTDPITTSTTNDDDSNKRDVDQVPKWDNRRVDRLNALAQSLTAASNKRSSQR